MIRLLALLVLAALSPAAPAAPTLLPGLYEYTVQMSMPGMQVGGMPPQVSQRCLNPKDVEGANAYTMPGSNTDCQVTDLKQDGGQFSYKMACTKPQQFNADVKGAITETTVALNMTMTIAEMPGPITQNVNARRLGDCKQ